MIEAERRMRESLAETTLASLAAEVRGKSSAENRAVRMKWFRNRLAERRHGAEDTEDKQK